MDYQTSSSTVALSQKLSTGHSIYDGVFTSAAAAAPSSSFTFSSSFDDYREIFGTAATLSSSIPVLQLPELNERKASVDVRSSKLDYSNVFGGGFGDGSDFSAPYEELFAEPKKRTKLMHNETSRIETERVSPSKKKAKSKSKSSCSVESVDFPNESAFESYDGVKKFKMSYNRSNHRSKSFAGVHTVPAYTCSVDETSLLRSTDGDEKPVTVAKERAVEGGNGSVETVVTRDLGDGDVKVEDNANWKSSIDELFNSNKPAAPAFSSQVLCDGDVPVVMATNDASNVNGFERNNGASYRRQASRDCQQAADTSKQSFGGVPKAQNSSKWRSSGAIDKFFYSGEIAQESRPLNMPPFSHLPSVGKSEVEKSVASMFGVLNADILRGDDSVASPPYFNEEVDTNSVAAASVAALTKAIEEAQASIRMAKELMDRKKVGVQSRFKLSFDDSTKPDSSKRNKFAERASMLKKTKTREVYDKADAPVHVSVRPEQATPVFENVIKSSDVMVPKEEMHEEKIADNVRISKEAETRELHEEVDVARDVSAGPEQVSVAIEEADECSGVKETRGKVHDEQFRPTPTDHRLEEVDDSEAAEEFYEIADTGEEVVSEAVDQFYEFADSSEPDASEATDEFYEFSDSSEHRELKLDNEDVNSTRQKFPPVDDDEEQHKNTDMEGLDNPEQGSKSLEATTEEEHGEVETIFNVVRGISEFKEHANELASSQEDSAQDDDDEKRQEALRDHEESGKLEETHVYETFEEKQIGDDEKFETRELYKTEHVKINLVTRERVEDEKTGMDVCMQKDDERGQTDAHGEEDTERSLNKDSDEVIIETVNDFYDKEDSDKRLEDDSESDGHDKLQDIKLNEMTLEEATHQKNECENSQEESFEVVDDGRGQTDAHSEEDTERSLNKDSDEVISETVNDFYDKEDIDKGPEEGSKSDGHDKLQDIKLEEMILEEATYQKKEFENSQEESFEVADVGRMQILTDECTKDEEVKAIKEDQKNLACEVDTGDNLYEQSAKEDLYNEEGSVRHVDYEQDVEETLEVPTKEDDGGVIEAAETLIGLAENEPPLEMVEEKNDMGEKEDICEPDGSTPSIKLPEMPKEKEEPTEIHFLHENEINASRNDTSFVQQEDDQLPSNPLECKLGRPVEEFEESGDINNDVIGAEVSVDQDSHKNSSKSRKKWFDSSIISETFIKLEEDGNQSESVEEEDVIEEKEICEIEGLASGVKLAEILKQMEDVIDIPSCDTDGPQIQDEQLTREAEVECNNLGKHVEELGYMNKGSAEPEVASVSPEQNINSSKSSHRKRWFDNGNETTVAQAPPLFAIHSLRRNLEEENYGYPETTDHTLQEVEGESRANPTAKESGTIFTPQKEAEPEKKENQQAAFEVSATMQKELTREKEQRIQKAAKRREREMQREQKKAVEQVMREARQRSFAEAQRGAEIRQKAEAQRRLGKTSMQANDTSLAEKASEEAKRKSERAYVEKATQEARDRALEKALSEKIASEAGKQAKRSVPEKSSGVSPDGKQAKRSVSEKLSGSSRDNGANSSSDLESTKVSLSTSRSSSSLTQCDPSSANGGESAQRCKAKLERNQRTAERAAKALAEKNNRDLLVQHEQAERNRLAEVLDAEVKRWSSGKERNLRALLSTLQYILGPDSGWQPVPLTDIVSAVAVKKAYRKAALCVHPDKLQQRGASIHQKYTCEKVFDLLKEAWNRFSAEER